MVGLIRVWPMLAAAALMAGCDGGASAVPVHKASMTSPTSVSRPEAVTRDGPETAATRVSSSAQRGGALQWSSNRRFTSEQNAERAFRRNGAAFGTTTVQAFVAKAHTFVTRPPKGAQIITRANGDRLIYDPASNVFAVATREGAPRTMFKPDEGAAYWEKVKAREAEGGARKSGSRTREEG